MGIIKLKQFIEDVKTGAAEITSDTATYATSAGKAGTAQLAVLATSAGKAGTAQVAVYATSAGGGAVSGTAGTTAS